MYELHSSWTIKHNQSIILGRLRDSSNSVAICGLLSAKSKQTYSKSRKRTKLTVFEKIIVSNSTISLTGTTYMFSET